MLNINKTSKNILFLMLLSPLLAYLYIFVFNLPKNITHFFVFLVFLYGIIYVTSKTRLIYPRFTIFMLLWAVYFGVLEYLLIRDRHIYTQLFHYLKFFSVFFIAVIVYNTRFSDKFIEKCILIIKITVVLTAIGSIIQVFNPAFLSLSTARGEDLKLLGDFRDLYQVRRSSIFGMIHPNALGLSFIPLLSLLVGYMLKNGDRNYIYFLILGGTAAMLSNTRFVMVGFLIITIQLLIFHKVRIGAIVKYVLVSIIMAAFSFYFLSYIGYDTQEWIDQRLFAEGHIEETSRYKAIRNFLIFFPQKPIFGHGEMTEEITAASRAVGSSHIHVGYLSHLVAFGLVGCFFLFGGWYLLTKRLHFTAKKTAYWGSLFAFITFFWSFATMSQSLIFYHGLIFAMVFDKYYRDKYIEKRKTITRETFTEEEFGKR